MRCDPVLFFFCSSYASAYISFFSRRKTIAASAAFLAYEAMSPQVKMERFLFHARSPGDHFGGSVSFLFSSSGGCGSGAPLPPGSEGIFFVAPRAPPFFLSATAAARLPPGQRIRIRGNVLYFLRRAHWWIRAFSFPPFSLSASGGAWPFSTALRRALLSAPPFSGFFLFCRSVQELRKLFFPSPSATPPGLFSLQRSHQGRELSR